MSNFYLYSNYATLFWLMALSTAVILQTLAFGYSILSLEKRGRAQIDNLLEFLILLHILGLVLLLAEVSFCADNGYVYPGGHKALRYGAFALITAAAAASAWRTRILWPLVIVPAALLTLPVTEELSGESFPVFFIAAALFWLTRSLHMVLRQRRQQSSRLTSLSIKEAVDSLDTGLLFFQQKGQIILQNDTMQKLMDTLMGQLQNNGNTFCEALERGAVREGCEKDRMGEQMVYHLPDQSVWSFALYPLTDGHGQDTLLVASDVTERWTANEKLWEQNQELERRNRELREVLDSLEEICRTETVLQAKGRVHDVLGQRISMLLRAMREHRQPDETLLQSFAEGLPKELMDVTADGGYSLDTLAKVFHTLGVAVHVNGWLPAREDLARTFYEIAVEAVTNAVRHGYATEVSIAFTEKNALCIMDVTNEGILPAGPVTEGGGLHGMREKAARLGGSFTYEVSDLFHIHVEIPKGGAE